jgi:hypothetical protein
MSFDSRNQPLLDKQLGFFPTGTHPHKGGSIWVQVRQVERLDKRVNDPSAGSPTETLLRLLLPLNDQV